MPNAPSHDVHSKFHEYYKALKRINHNKFKFVHSLCFQTHYNFVLNLHFFIKKKISKFIDALFYTAHIKFNA